MPTQPEPPEKKPRVRDRVRSYFRKPPSTSATIFIAVLGVFLAGAVGTGVSFLVKPLTDATSSLPTSTFLAGGIGVALGLLMAWVSLFFYYRLRTHATALELHAARHELGKLDHAKETLGRVEIYADHIYIILETLAADSQSLRDLSSAETQRAVRELPEDYLREATGLSFSLSVWAEPDRASAGIIGRTATRIRENIPDKVADPVAAALPGGPKFQLLTDRFEKDEREAFEVRIESSWLKHRQSGEEDEPYPEADDSEVAGTAPESQHTRRRLKNIERFVYSADEPYSKLTGGDINGFKRFHYAAVRAVAFRRGERICYLVAMSKEENAFTEAEDQYLLWLKGVLELDSVVYDSDQPASGRTE